MSAPVTSLYAGILGLMLVALTTRVVVGRWRAGVGIGHGDSKSLRRWIRVHANFAEHVPLAVVLLLVCELNGVDDRWLHAAASALVVARVLHVLGLSRSPGISGGRFTGSLLTVLIMVFLGGLAIWKALL